MPPSQLASLSRARGLAPDAALVARPPSRLLTRTLVPALIVLSALALLIYAARESFRRATAVTVAPVVARTGGASQAASIAPGEIVQAPGWIEAAPSAVGVPALAEGVLKDLLVLDGERVEKGQVVAVLIDDDAKLAAGVARAELARAEAAIREAQGNVAVEESRLPEIEDQIARFEAAEASQAISTRERVVARLRLQAQRVAVEAAMASVARAEADERGARVGVEQAELALSRMSVRAPMSGVVLQRLVEPGQRLMRDANNPFAGVVLRLYDPEHIQVRVDVPLADAAKVRMGDEAEITTETLPGRTFKGTLTRFVHEANLQKNTVQVKVEIADPAPELKLDMLAKARITTRGTGNARDASPAGRSTTEGALIVPRAALVDVSGTQAVAWVLDRETSTAEKRTLRVGQVNTESADVLEGLRPGDRVIVNPPADLKSGAKVRPAGEQENR